MMCRMSLVFRSNTLPKAAFSRSSQEESSKKSTGDERAQVQKSLLRFLRQQRIQVNPGQYLCSFFLLLGGSEESPPLPNHFSGAHFKKCLVKSGISATFLLGQVWTCLTLLSLGFYTEYVFFFFIMAYHTHKISLTQIILNM